MKRLLLSSISILFISVLPVSAVRAEIDNNNTVYRVEPFYLVHLGYQGYFERQGIPGNGAFISAVESGKITPTLLVQSAIDSGRLDPDTINDRSYLDSVATQLKFIETR